MQDLPDLRQTLHQIFIKADAQRQRAESAYDRFEHAIDDTGLPIEYWEPCVHRQLHLLQRHQHATYRHFTRSLHDLQAFQKSQPPPKPPEPEAEPDEPYQGFTYRQTVYTNYVDGVLVTSTTQDAAYWLNRRPTLHPYAFIRYFFFANAEIPEPYKYVLINPEDGTIEPNPKPYIEVSYEPEEFFRLCELEIETKSPHLLGGDPYEIIYNN